VNEALFFKNFLEMEERYYYEKEYRLEKGVKYIRRERI